MNNIFKNSFCLDDLGVKPLRVLTYPSPALKRMSNNVDVFDDKLGEFVNEMIRTMYLSRGIGLAAPQVGKNIRIFISDTDFEFDEENENIVLNANPIVFINPKIIKKKGETIYEEGCLSFPGIYEKVKRFEKITIEYQDLDGAAHELEAEGLKSICLQHELDHLNGIVFIEKLSPLKQSLLKKKFLKSKKK